MTFEEMLHQGITEDNYREKWAEHLVRQGIKSEVAAAHVKQLEEYYLRMVPESDQPFVDAARQRGASPYLAARLLGETKRTVRVPGEWLTEFKKLSWPKQ